MALADPYPNPSLNFTTRCLLADGTFGTFSIPKGVLFVAPGNSPATSYDAASATWTTFQGITAGATSLSTITFITAGVYALPPQKSVRRFPVLCRTVLASARSMQLMDRLPHPHAMTLQ